MLAPSHRVDYGRIAHLYDGQPFRDKTVDPELTRFLQETSCGSGDLSVLDLGCGTGNQAVANLPYIHGARLVGLDFFHEMLAQARPKARDISWVQGDSANPPFIGRCFDFITSQFSFHHVRDQRGMLASVYRLLRPSGRFVMTNICPRDMPGWIAYQFFPEAYNLDMQDFMPLPQITYLMAEIGFINVDAVVERETETKELREFARALGRRDYCSQLMAIPDEAYQAGMARLEQAQQQCGDEPVLASSEFALLTLTANKPDSNLT